MTFIAALRHDQISAPWVIARPTNGELLILYMRSVGAHSGKKARWSFSIISPVSFLKDSGYVSAYKQHALERAPKTSRRAVEGGDTCAILG